MKNIFIDKDLSLRMLSAEDAEYIFSCINQQRDYLGKWLPFVEKTMALSDTLEYIESVITNPNLAYEPVYTIQFNEKFAGIIGLKASDVLNRRTEIGYWLSETEQHKGIMTRCVKALINYVFEKMRFNRIQIKCASGNISSIEIPKRLGFKFEGIEREGEILAGGMKTDLVLYAILSSEWNS